MFVRSEAGIDCKNISNGAEKKKPKKQTETGAEIKYNPKAPTNQPSQTTLVQHQNYTLFADLQAPTNLPSTAERV